jgi:hypothetical protein
MQGIRVIPSLIFHNRECLREVFFRQQGWD